MALTNLHGLEYFPRWPLPVNPFNGSISFESLSSASSRFGVIVRAPKAGTIEKIHFRAGTVSGSQTLRAAIESLSSTGIPSNTTTHFRDVAVASSNTWFTSGIVSDDGTDGGVKKSVSAGDAFAIVFSLQSYSSGNLAMSILFGVNNVVLDSGLVYTSGNSGTTWVEQSDDSPCIALEYTGGEIVYLGNSMPISAATATDVGNGSNPDEYALKLRVPAPLRAIGVFLQGDGTDIEALVYDAGGAVVAGPATAFIKEGTDTKLRAYYFSSPVEIAKNSDYRIAWRPSTATARQIVVYDVAAAANRGGTELGTNMQLSTRVDAGSWADSATKFIVAGFIVEALDDGSAGGVSCTFGALSNGTRVIPVAQ